MHKNGQRRVLMLFHARLINYTTASTIVLPPVWISFTPIYHQRQYLINTFADPSLHDALPRTLSAYPRSELSKNSYISTLFPQLRHPAGQDQPVVRIDLRELAHTQRIDAAPCLDRVAGAVVRLDEPVLISGIARRVGRLLHLVTADPAEIFRDAP